MAIFGLFREGLMPTDAGQGHRRQSRVRGRPSQITGGLMLLVVVGGLLIPRVLWQTDMNVARLRPEVTATEGSTSATASLSTKSLAPLYRVDINEATLAELLNLPEVGPSTAAKILAHRQRGGKFHRLSDLETVPGIGPQTLKQIEPYLLFPTLPAPLQTRSADEPASDSDTILMATNPEQANP